MSREASVTRRPREFAATPWNADGGRPAWGRFDGRLRGAWEARAAELDAELALHHAPESRAYLEAMAGSDSSPFFRRLESAATETAVMDGHRVVMLGANNYLGLTTDPRVTRASIAAIEQYGTGCTGSRFMNGTLPLHLELEGRLARFLHKEAALVFSAGFLANVGVLSVMGGRHAYLFSDRANHASICDGISASLAESLRFEHNDPDSLREKLRRAPVDAAKWVIVEGVHSMFGDVCPLPEIVAVARTYGARILLDDAHGVGVLGDGGRGTANLYGVESEIDLIVGTFSKSFASYGGFVAGDRATIESLRYATRSFIFTAGPPPATVASVLAALDVLEHEPTIVARLRQNALELARRLRAAGLLDRDPPAAIIPLVIGPNDRTWKAWTLLYEGGVYTNAAFPPGVPAGQALLRLSLMATLRPESLEYAASAIASAFEVLGLA